MTHAFQGSALVGVWLFSLGLEHVNAGSTFGVDIDENVACFDETCSANEIFLGQVTNVVILDGDGCASPSDFVTFSATFAVQLQAMGMNQERFDVGLWFAVGTGDTTANGGSLCTAITLDSTVDLDCTATDICGDISSAFAPLQQDFTVTLPCQNVMDGVLVAPYCTAWSSPGQMQNRDCTTASMATPRPTANCRCNDTFVIEEIPVSTPAPITPEPTTAAPTTAAPTTAAPTTAAPTTGEPTTAEPTTAAPTTAEPTTAAPTTAEPTTAAPTTAEPTTAAPTTAEPTTAAPTTAAPTTAAPTTAEPTTAEPTTAEPTTAAPTTAEPTTAQPTTAEPSTAQPTTSAPTTAEPTTPMPVTLPPESPAPISPAPTKKPIKKPKPKPAGWWSTGLFKKVPKKQQPASSKGFTTKTASKATKRRRTKPPTSQPSRAKGKGDWYSSFSFKKGFSFRQHGGFAFKKGGGYPQARPSRLSPVLESAGKLSPKSRRGGKRRRRVPRHLDAGKTSSNKAPATLLQRRAPVVDFAITS